MQEILDKMDKMKVQTKKKLDNIYQMILVQRRRKRLRELQKKKNQAKQEQNSLNATPESGAASSDKQEETHQRLRRNLFQPNKFKRDMFQMPRGLAMNQQGLYNFGRIAEQEQNFGSLVDPSLIQRPQQP